MATILFPGITPQQNQELHDLIEANRVRALWTFPQDYYPSDVNSARRVLKRIAARGDRATFTRARQLLNLLK